MVRAATVAVVVLASLVSTAWAQAFEVVSVPWVGTAPAVPHDAIVDQPHYLQAVARNCDQAIEYRWDFDGNGLYDLDWAAAPNRWNLGTQYTYQGLEEARLFIARVEGRCGGEGGATATADFPIRVHVNPTLGLRVNRAISNGLWFGHISLVRDVANQTANVAQEIDTAMLAQAMMNRGHRHGVDPAVDPYVEDAQWMLHFVASHLETRAIADLQQGENADVNGNGIGLRTRGEENYVGGGCLELLASWGDMDYVLPPAAMGQPANVAERRLGDVVQDAAEYFMWAQSEIAFEDGLAGGWDYSVNSGNIDSSQVGWAAVGLFAAEVNGGAEIPQWLKDRLRLGVRFMDSGRVATGAVEGRYGYRSPGDYVGNAARSGAMLNALGFATGGDRADPGVLATVGFVAGQFDNPSGDGFPTQILANFYAMYQVSKGMRSFSPQFDLIGDGIDWYQRIATWLVDHQLATGSWNAAEDVRWTSGRLWVTNGIALLVLIPTLFEAPPTAVAQAAPTLVGPGDTVTFYHGGSYVLDPSAPITTYRWNFVDYPVGFDANGDGDFDDAGDFAPEDANGDGVVNGDEIVWEVVTNDPNERPTFAFDANIGFGEVAVFPITLQVEDDLGRTDLDRESVTVEVSYVNHPPVAIAHPDGNDATYTGPLGGLVQLDASASFDPDSDDDPAAGFPRDSLTFVGWDLDGDGVFETEQAQVDLRVPLEWLVGSTRVIQVRVCDDGTWTGTPDAECEGGDCSICRTADARIQVTRPLPQIDLGGEVAFDVDEGKILRIDTSGSEHPGGFDFELVVYCDGISASVGPDGTIAVDAGAVDGVLVPVAYTCTVTALDELGGASSLDFTVTVNNAAPEVTLARVEGEPVEGGTVDVRILANDVPGDAPFLLYSVDCDGDGIFEVRNTRNNVVECRLNDGRYDPIVRVDDQDGGVVLVELPGFDVANIPPSFGPVACPETREGELLVLQLGVSDPADQVLCNLSAPAPDRSQIAAGDCTLVWTPTYEQALAGEVDFTIFADDGDGGVGRLDLTCFPTVRDDDGDGLPDSWEERFGTDPTVDDCDVDYDLDGMSNCEEFEGGTLPRVYEGPGMPSLISPIGGVIVRTATPDLVSRNTTDTLGRSLDYVYWLYDSADAVDPIHMSNPVDETPNQTSYRTPNGLLQENRTYWWTVAATNGVITGPSPARARFVVDAIEEPAPAPRILTPPNGGTSPDGVPPIALTPVVDPDPGDVLTYECQAATDADFDDVEDTAEGANVGGQVTVLFGALPGDTTYWIRCRAVDQDGEPGLWSDPIRYSINRPPVAGVDPPVLTIGEGGDGVVTSTSTDPDEGELTYTWWCPDALDYEADGPVLNVSADLDAPAAGRSFQCRLTVTDAHGASDTTTFVVRVDNLPPSAEVVCPDTEEGTPVQILVEGTDPGGDQLACAWAAPAPDASALAGCTVEWTPTYAQAIAGEVRFNVRLSDDDGASVDVPFTCTPRFRDGDGNGLPDTWEEDNDVEDPDGDNDGDGVSNRDEWADGTDPNHYDGPSELVLVEPIDDAIVDTATPDLVVQNGTDGLGRDLSYRYAIFADGEPADPIFTSDLVPEGDGITALPVPADLLDENMRYWWTAQGDNGVGAGPWAEPESFRIDALPEAPDPPTIVRPMDGDAVDDTPVRVTLDNATDPDPESVLTYTCELASTAEFAEGTVIADAEADEGPDGRTRVDIEALVDENATYWIRCKATDDTGLDSEWSEPVQVGIDRTNEPPTAPTVFNPEPDTTAPPGDFLFEVGGSTDPEDDDLTYFIEVGADPDFLAVLFTASAEADGDNRASFGPEALGEGAWYVRTWAHDGLLAGPATTVKFIVFDPTPSEDTINGGGCACDASESDRTSPLVALLGLLILGLRRRRR